MPTDQELASAVKAAVQSLNEAIARAESVGLRVDIRYSPTEYFSTQDYRGKISDVINSHGQLVIRDIWRSVK
jgi:hypothetical protein